MSVRELDSSPNLLGLYAKAAVTSVSGGNELPDDELVLRDVSIDRDHLAEYDRVCGFRLRDRLPATYPHVIAFPLAVEIMASRDFPFALPGLVHIRNAITLHRPIESSERLSVRVRTTNLRDHPKGRQFEIVSEAEVDGEIVWTEVGTILKKGEGSGDGDGPDDPEQPPQTALWKLPADTGRRYAAVSGDRNPIHLHPLTAKLFGFPRQIAHGMWSKARCLAALEERLPEAFEVEASFKKPVILPTSVAFGAREEDGGWTFGMRSASSDTPHLVGRVREV